MCSTALCDLIGDHDPGWLRRTHPFFAASLWHQCVGETVLTANAHHKIIFSRAAGQTGVIQLACDNATHAFVPLTDALATMPPGAPPLWANACEICTLLHADMTKLERPFVLMSFDTLNPGIDRGGTMGAYVIHTSFAFRWCLTTIYKLSCMSIVTSYSIDKNLMSCDLHYPINFRKTSQSKNNSKTTNYYRPKKNGGTTSQLFMVSPPAAGMRILVHFPLGTNTRATRVHRRAPLPRVVRLRWRWQHAARRNPLQTWLRSSTIHSYACTSCLHHPHMERLIHA